MHFFLGFLVAALFFASIRFLIFRRWRRFGMYRGAACGPGGAGRRWPFRSLFRRLDTSPSQEQVLIDQAAALREAFGGLRADWLDARRELAELLGESAVDPARVEKVLAGSDERLVDLRRRAAEALTRFHATLDGAQREALATLVRDGRGLRPAYGWHHHD
jgi:hypothetical protein